MNHSHMFKLLIDYDTKENKCNRKINNIEEINTENGSNPANKKKKIMNLNMK